MSDRLSVHDRVTVLAALERISYELVDIASWLSGQDADVAAVMLEDGARISRRPGSCWRRRSGPGRRWRASRRRTASRTGADRM